MVEQKLNKCFECVRKKTDFVPDVALVLGSGLGALADEIDTVCTVSYNDIDGFPVSTVQGHKGRFVFGYIEGVKTVIMQGRVHYYEGYEISDVVLPIRLMKLLGANTLFLTNASGGINSVFSAGDFMIIKDQIANFVPSPLIGKNIDSLGTRFPDMSEIYDKKYIEIMEKTARKLDINIQKGVYIQLSGPNFESPAEVRMCRILGADAVGMSTACEAVAANHMGMRICGIACISNLACGMTAHPLSHEEVYAAADAAAPKFKLLVKEIIKEISKV